MSILIGIRKFQEKEERYKVGKEYNMCQAMEEMMEDSRLEGKEEGREEGEAKKMISMIDNTLKNLRCSLEEACRITGQNPVEYGRAKALLLRK